MLKFHLSHAPVTAPEGERFLAADRPQSHTDPSFEVWFLKFDDSQTSNPQITNLKLRFEATTCAIRG
jgi:hypothetical protein